MAFAKERAEALRERLARWKSPAKSIPVAMTCDPENPVGPCEDELIAHSQALEMQAQAAENLLDATSFLSAAQASYNDAVANYVLAGGLVAATQSELDACLAQ